MPGSGIAAAQARLAVVDGLRRWARRLADRSGGGRAAGLLVGRAVSSDPGWPGCGRAPGRAGTGWTPTPWPPTRPPGPGMSGGCCGWPPRLVNGDPLDPAAGRQPGRAACMNVWDVLSPGWLAYLVGALIVSVAVGVAVLVAIGTAEVGPVGVRRSGSQRSGRAAAGAAAGRAGRQGPIMMGLSTGRDEPAAFFRPEVIRVSLWLVLALWLARQLARLMRLDHPHPVRGRDHHRDHGDPAGLALRAPRPAARRPRRPAGRAGRVAGPVAGHVRGAGAAAGADVVAGRVRVPAAVGDRDGHRRPAGRAPPHRLHPAAARCPVAPGRWTG